MCAKAPAVPAALPEIPLSVGRGASCRQYQEKGEVGGGVVEYSWSVADHYPKRTSQVHIDVVITNGRIGHDAKLSRSTS
jgi:hypothetical protein